MNQLKTLFSQYTNLPNIAGEGMLFAYSGMDGTTHSVSNFVFTMHNQQFDFLLQTEFRHQLRMRSTKIGKVLAAVGDVFAVEFEDGILALSFSDWHTLVGIIPDGCSAVLFDEKHERESDLSICDSNGSHVALKVDGTRLSIAFGNNAEEATQRAKTGVLVDAGKIIKQRLSVYHHLPHLQDKAKERLLQKCFSVMKVNTLNAEGPIKQAWSTPDRVPHRDMWLWDSVFHSLAMNLVDAKLSWQFLKSVLDTQHSNGLISHQAKVNGWCSEITQPPILVWGVWENYQVTKDRQNLEYAAERLGAYLTWDTQHRDQNQNGMLEWFIEENEFCRSGESGMDNSQRFDEALLLDAVDFSTFAALDMCYLSKIYQELGETTKAENWLQRSTRLSETVHQSLWDKQKGLYFDRRMDGSLSDIEAVTGFLPMLLDDFPKDRLVDLLTALNDPERFATECPIPSVSVATPDWSTDMWRGATWINMNYLVSLGFEKQGCQEIANHLRTQTLAMVQKYYEKDGVIYEFYDAKDQRSPAECDRKGPRQEPYDFRRKMDSIRDYHWSAALCFLMLLKKL